jgi:2-dehydro-3-deoxyphosphogluconate aldolase/(4S)-4-hydroxy-2-oxoglutarate aldolase
MEESDLAQRRRVDRGMVDLIKELADAKIIAIVRGIPDSAAEQTAESLADGGIKFIEVTMNTEGALNIIRQWKERFHGRLHIGAGTVLDISMAKEAVAAGAEYLVTPNLDEEVIRYAVNNQIEIFPGTMTPTEIVRAWKAGASAVKVFPTGVLGSGYIKELQGPLGHIKMVATGGVNLDNIHEFFNAGTFAVGLGNNLVDKKLIQAGAFGELTELAKRFVKAVNKL